MLSGNVCAACSPRSKKPWVADRMRDTKRGVRLYRLLLLTFPPAFRREFGADMTELLATRLEEEGRGAAARTRIWLEVLGDLATEVPKEWARTITMTPRGGERMSMGGWFQDLRLGARNLVRRPGFTAAAAGTLALGIGAVVALFSVVHGVLLTPLPYPDSERVVVLWKTDIARGGRSNTVDHPDIAAWRGAAPGFDLAGYAGSRPTLTGLGDPEVIEIARVTHGLLSVFGVAPILGRDLTEDDDVPDGPRVAVVSRDFWQSRLGARPDAVGELIELNGEAWEVVGVAPPGFRFPDNTKAWVPRRHDVSDCGHGCNIMRAVGRLPSGSTAEAVEQRLAGVDRALSEEFPDSHRDDGTDLQSMHEYLVADVQTALFILMAAVGMVLLIACANVANLMAVRAAGRTGELAVRSALGASGGRLVRQLFAEALVLAGFAGAAGLILAALGVEALTALAPSDLPRADEIGLDGTSVAFGLALTVFVAVLFGVMPARRAASTSVATTLRSAERGSGHHRAGLSRGLLLAGEVSLSLTLLLGAGLMFRTLQEMRSVDLGFRPDGVERFRISAPESRYDTEGALQFFDELEDRLSAIPGVTAVGHGFGVPFSSGSIGTGMSFPDRPPVDEPDQPGVSVRPVSPGYLDALGLKLVSGRWFNPSDRADVPAVAVLNEAAVRAHMSDTDPIGRRFDLPMSWGFDEQPTWTVVGVVADVRGRESTQPEVPAVYLPNAQFGSNVVYFTIRRGNGGASALPAARRALASLDPEIAPTGMESLAEAIARASADTRFYLTLLTVFSGLALLLAGVGLYGVVAYTVSQRAREIGIRRALGAGEGNVVGMVMRQGVAPAVLGVVVGLGGAWYAGRALSSLLYGIRPYDPLTLLSVTALLLAVVAVATLVPARRASRIAPATALRDD